MVGCKICKHRLKKKPKQANIMGKALYARYDMLTHILIFYLIQIAFFNLILKICSGDAEYDPGRLGSPYNLIQIQFLVI